MEKEKGLRFNKFPISAQGKTTIDLSHHQRRGNNHNTGTLVQVPKSQSDTPQGSSHKSSQELPQALQILSLTKNVKGLNRRKINQHTFFLQSPSRSLLSPFSFPLSAHLLFVSTFFVPSSLPSTSSLNKLLRKFSSCKALCSLITSPSSLGNASVLHFSLASVHRPSVP